MRRLRIRKAVTIKARRKYRKSDKMLKTRIIVRSAYVNAHVPTTRLYSYRNLLRLLTVYGMVYIKPKYGSLGRGVIRIVKNGTRYSAHAGTTISSYATFDGLYRAMSSRIRGKSYIVQRGIEALRYNGSIFDFRVVVQLSPSGQFEVTGIAGRVSQAGRVVSNAGGGAAVGTIDSLLTPMQYHIVVPRIEKLSLAVMRQVRRTFTLQKEIGIDIAIDHNLKPWVIEYNTSPNHDMFVIMRDHGTLARIIHYGARYGRRYRLTTMF